MNRGTAATAAILLLGSACGGHPEHRPRGGADTLAATSSPLRRGTWREVELSLNVAVHHDIAYMAVGDTVRAIPSVCLGKGDSGVCQDSSAAAQPPWQWNSSDSLVATVNQQGTVLAMHPGHAQLTVERGRERATRRIRVLPAIASLAWEPATRVVPPGDTLRLTAVGRDAAGHAVVRVPLMGVINPDSDIEVDGWDDTTGVRVWGRPGAHVALTTQIGHRRADAIVRIGGKP